jgi:hypothetical protein
LGWSLVGIITPNFDCYIEDALEGIAPVSRHILGDVDEVPAGLPLLKPHGSLDRPDSICITIDRVARPLKGDARRAFQELVSGRVVLVVGYSGWDYDLLPLLAAATQEWESKILWLLYDETSWNERVGRVKLANPEHCQVINCKRVDVLPRLAGRPVQPTIFERPKLRSEFRSCFDQKTDESLMSAVLSLLTPMGVPESSGIVEALCAELIAMARDMKMADDRQALKALGHVVSLLDDDDTRREAAAFALERAKRLGDTAAVRSYQREVDCESKSVGFKGRLAIIERDLIELFPVTNETEPDPVNAERSMKTSLLTEKAQLLMDYGNVRECEELVQDILINTEFPESGISPNSWIVNDGYLAAPLLELLGSCVIEHGETIYADEFFAEAVGVLWREKALWELWGMLTRLSGEVSKSDRGTAQLAMEIAVATAHFERDKLSELIALEWILDFGLGGQKELKAARAILADLVIDEGDRETHEENLSRFERRLQRTKNY